MDGLVRTNHVETRVERTAGWLRGISIVTSGDRDVDNVREATDLVRLIGEHVALRPRGREHVGLCPFHDDHTPSFSVVTHKGGSGFYKCHACGAAGDAFRFVMDYHKMAFPEALRFLAERAGITLQPRRPASANAESSAGTDRARLLAALEFGARFFRSVLSRDETHQRLVRARVDDPSIVDAFQLGAAPDSWDALLAAARRAQIADRDLHAAGLVKQRTDGSGYYDAFRCRLIFPIGDDLGRPIAFGARKIRDEDEPKYLNSPETPVFHKSATLYGLHLAKRSIIDTKQAIVTEGYTDVIACHCAGITNVVGTLGTALTRDHARKLAKLCTTVVLVFDGDDAGMRAADRAVEVFFAERIDVRICVLPDGLDPDELLKQPEGRERFDLFVAGAVDALAYKVGRFRRSLAGADGMSGRQAAMEAFLGELAALGFSSMPGLRRQMVLSELSDLLKVSIADLAAAMPSRPLRRQVLSSPPDEQAATAPSATIPPLPPDERRRWLTERQLLALLLGRPDLLDCQVDLAALGQGLPLEIFAPREFHDPAAIAIALVMIAADSREPDQLMTQLLTRLNDDPAARALLVKLHTQAGPLCDGLNDEIHERLQQTCRTLATLSEEHRFAQAVQVAAGSPAPNAEDLRGLLEQRRRQGYRSAALPRVRT